MNILYPWCKFASIGYLSFFIFISRDFAFYLCGPSFYPGPCGFSLYLIVLSAVFYWFSNGLSTLISLGTRHAWWSSGSNIFLIMLRCGAFVFPPVNVHLTCTNSNSDSSDLVSLMALFHAFQLWTQVCIPDHSGPWDVDWPFSPYMVCDFPLVSKFTLIFTRNICKKFNFTEDPLWIPPMAGVK